MLTRVNGVIPMDRHARPEEIAGLYVYLASDEAAYASGAVFMLDGAKSAGLRRRPFKRFCAAQHKLAHVREPLANFRVGFNDSCAPTAHGQSG